LTQTLRFGTSRVEGTWRRGGSPRLEVKKLELRCYLCDEELDKDAKPFKVGMKEEMVCGECYMKTVNRRKALDKDG